MVLDSASTAETFRDGKTRWIESLILFFKAFWIEILIGFIFSITRIRYLAYPLGLMHRQPVKEGYRSYEAVLSQGNFGIPIIQNPYIEQPIYVFLLELGYQLSGYNPDGLVLWGRILGFIFSGLSLIVIYKIGDITFGDIAAKFSAFLYILSPYGVTMGIAIQRETLMWLFGLMAVFFLIKYLNNQKKQDLTLNLVFALMCVFTKLTGFYILFTSLVVFALFYEDWPKGIKLSFYHRMALLFITTLAIILFSLTFSIGRVELSEFSAFRHTIAIQPEALIDTEFWGNIVVNAMIFIPVTTVLLGGIGLISVVTSRRPDVLLLTIWMFFAGVTIVFYGYGAIIHEYYVLFLLHPLSIFAGYTLSLIFQLNIDQFTENPHIPQRIANPVLMLFLLTSSGFIPWFNFTGEEKMVRANSEFHADIRSIGLSLRESNLQGWQIAILYLKENYVWWRFQLTLIRTYIAKPGIKEMQVSNISQVVLSENYTAIIAWSDDLDQFRPTIESHFRNSTIFAQETLFRGNFEIPSIEVWFN